MRQAASIFALLLGLMAAAALSGSADAMPAFSRRYDMACGSCHQGHYPRLNAFGRDFRDAGYQLPGGATEPAPGGLLRELPLGVRGQVFGLVPLKSGEDPAVQTSLTSYVIGGGPVTDDVSFFFSWTPFPEPTLHQARVGVHDLWAEQLGEGTLNVRAGALFLLDFARPSHRHLFAAPASATAASVGSNTFVLDDANLGVQLYGRPGLGPFHYDVAVVAGDMGGGLDRDDGKDVFARAAYTAFHRTDHELTAGAFGYVGRSVIETKTPDFVLVQRDDYWLAGGDLELDLGRLDLFGTGYASRHADPALHGAPVIFGAVRGEAIWTVTPKIVGALRYERVASKDDPLVDRHDASAHLTWVFAPNVLWTAGWRQDLADPLHSSALVSADVAF